MNLTGSSRPASKFAVSTPHRHGEQAPHDQLLQTDVFWDYCWPARLASVLDARRAASELDRLAEPSPACVVTAGRFSRKGELTRGPLKSTISSSQWQSNGILARHLADTCASILEEPAIYRGINTLHVLHVHLILKLLPLVNFLHAFELWAEEFRGCSAYLAAGPSMTQILQPLAAKRMVALRVKSLPAGEAVQRLRARFYRPNHGWRSWKRTGRLAVGSRDNQADVLFTLTPGSPLKIVRALIEHQREDASRLAAVAAEKPCLLDWSTRLYNVETGRPLLRHRIDRAILDQMTAQHTRLRETFTYQGVSLWPVVEPHLVAVVKTMVPAVAQAIDGLDELFSQLRPRVLVVSNNSVWPDRAAILVAKRLGIPSLAIQDGDYQVTWPWEILSDKIAVQGEQSARVLDAFGTPRAKIELTGQVRYDHLTRAGADRGKQALREKLGIRTGYLAVVATDPGSLTHSPLEKQNNESYAIQELAGLANWSLILKLHPQDKGRITRSLARSRPEIRVISNEFSAEELIAACDLWVSTASTTAVEAVIAGRPVALLNCNGGDFMPELVEAGVATYVSDDGELQAVAKNVERSEEKESDSVAKREAFLRDRLYKLDGQSTERVVALIQKMSCRPSEGPLSRKVALE